MPDYPTDEYTDEEEYQDNFLDEQREAWDETTGNYPTAKKPDNLFSLFKDVWKTSDSSKVANLNNTEIGDLGMSVRNCQDIALFADILDHPGVRDYFKRRGEIVLATSMSRGAKFVELFVTTKKLAQKGVLGNKSGNQQQNKWRIFGQKQQTAQTEEA